MVLLGVFQKSSGGGSGDKAVIWIDCGDSKRPSWGTIRFLMTALLLFQSGCSGGNLFNREHIAPLKFASSGRLTRNVHGFTLGMSLPAALDSDPDLLDFKAGEPYKPSASKLDRTLGSKFHDGIPTETLVFVAGRLIWMDSDLSNVSPADAQEFDRSMISAFGKPDKEVYEGPIEKRWVWIDGDVRVLYDNMPVESQGRRLELESSIYPLWISSGSKNPGGFIDTKQLISNEKRDWGDDQAVNNFKLLPHGLENIQLGMTPQELQSEVLNVQLSAINEHEMRGVVNDSDSFPVWSVEFWDGIAYRIYRRWPVSTAMISFHFVNAC